MSMPQSNLVASQSVDRTTFENLYAGLAPWDIGRPQGCVIAIAHRVTGIDFVEAAIRRARLKAAERGESVEFLVKNATALGDWGRRFASVIDFGLFHVRSDDDRQRYVEGLTRVVEPGGRLFLMCFSDAEPGAEGPRRVSRRELFETFANDWEVEAVQPVRGEINPKFTEVQFSEGGPKMWFAVVRRQG